MVGIEIEGMRAMIIMPPKILSNDVYSGLWDWDGGRLVAKADAPEELKQEIKRWNAEAKRLLNEPIEPPLPDFCYDEPYRSQWAMDGNSPTAKATASESVKQAIDEFNRVMGE